MKMMKLPPQVKWVLIGLAVVVVLVIVYYFWSGSAKRKDTKSSNDLVDRVNKEIDPKQLTLTDQQALSMADALESAMTTWWGTDEDAIYDVFSKCYTRSDVLKIVGAFGTRNGENLTQWLRGDLNKDEMKVLNDLLTNKGINYQF